MADRDRLIEALKAADAAGDTEGATKIAQALRGMDDASSPTGLTGAIPTQTADQSKPEQSHTFGQKFAFGAGDIPAGIGQALAHVPPGDAYETMGQEFDRRELGKTLGPQADKAVQQREAKWQRERVANKDTGIEFARGLGGAVASAPLAAMIPGGAGVFGSMGSGMLAGGMSAGLNPVISGDYNKGKASQIGLGAGLGGLLGAATGTIGKAVNPKVNEDVAFLRARGVEPTLGQNIGAGAATFEDTLSSVNPAIAYGQKRAVEQFNRAAYNEALKPVSDALGEDLTYTGPVGRKGIKAVGDLLSRGYDAVKDRIGLLVDDQVQADLGAIRQEADVTTKELGEKFQRLLQKNVYDRANDEGILTGQAFKDAESALTRIARRYAPKGGDDSALAEHLFDAADVLRDHLARLNPEEAPTLQALNKGWAILARIEDAAPTGSADAIFTPAQLARSVERADSTVRHRAYVRGEALLQPLSDAALRVLGNKYPNSGTAGRYLAGSAILGGAGAFSPGGAAALASTSLAYTPVGQRMAGALLNGGRPAFAPSLQRGISAATPMLANGLIFGALPR